MSSALWLICPAIFDYQEVRNSISFVAPSRLIYSCRFKLSGSGHFHFMSSTITAELFPPSFSIIRKCVISFYSQHHPGWLVLAVWNCQEVCISIPWTGKPRLTCSCHFHSQAVRSSILLAAPSRLTCPRHFRLSGSAYLYFMSSIIMGDTFLPFRLSVGA